MNRDNTPWQPIQSAELDWADDSGPRSKHYGDVYFSTAGGLDEAEYVFLGGNGLPERWENHDRAVFCIVETGFGTGLNFLATWNLWRQQGSDRRRLHYISVEKHPLKITDLARVLRSWPTLAHLAAQLLESYPEPIRGQHRLVLEGGQLILDLWWEDVEDALESLAGDEHRPVDAWYLDGFAPACNERMWNDRLYNAMAAASRHNATFSTFTAASEVRRGLSAAGFTVAKASGFGRKRERLHGIAKGGLPDLPVTHTPWHLKHRQAKIPASVIVLGAGLAGCTLANALAQRDIEVTLIEADHVASAGSGNSQGILYTRLSSRHSSLTDFALQSFCFAHHFYQSLFANGQLSEADDGSLCGSFHQNENAKEMLTLRKVLADAPELAEVLDCVAAAARTGVEQPSGGYWFPKSGWMRPESVCHALINHPKITLMDGMGPVALQQNSIGWSASNTDRALAAADCAVIATGTSVRTHPALSWLPGQFIRGQTTQLPTNNVFGELSAGLCHTGYMAPARQGSHCIGATFDIKDDESEVRIADHQRNLDALALAVPRWRETIAKIDPQSLTGRVAYRYATPDYLPIVGSVPQYDAFLQTYAGLRKNAKKLIPQRGDYLPGLFVNTGHGSRGLTSTPLAAQILASEICGEALPISMEMKRTLSPARFLIRNLRRGLL